MQGDQSKKFLPCHCLGADDSWTNKHSWESDQIKYLYSELCVTLVSYLCSTCGSKINI